MRRSDRAITNFRGARMRPVINVSSANRRVVSAIAARISVLSAQQLRASLYHDVV